MRKYELSCNLIERIAQLDLNVADRRVALQNARRARQLAELLQAVGAGVKALAESVIAAPARCVAAWISRRPSGLARRRPHSS